MISCLCFDHRSDLFSLFAVDGIDDFSCFTGPSWFDLYPESVVLVDHRFFLIYLLA